MDDDDGGGGYRFLRIPFSSRIGTLKLGVRVPTMDELRNAGRSSVRNIKQAWNHGINVMNGNTGAAGIAGTAGDGDTAGAGAGVGNNRTDNNPLDFPSLIQFFSSRYSISLLLLSLLINRIHAVVPPNIHYRSSWKVRAIVRGPAIFLLTRACVMMLGVVLRMGEENETGATAKAAFGFARLGGASMLNGEVTGRDHSDALWASFIAACMACASESFIRALDHDLASITPINLFTLGLLLHFHSMPYGNPIVPPPRPVYLLLLLTLLEILSLHVAAVPGWRIRLWITGAFTLVSRGLMIHFWLNTTERAHIALMPAIQSLGRILPEAFFVTCSIITVTLRALSQAFTEGRIDSSIFGHSSSLPHRDDDFILAIIKYGTAALETTAMKGLNNEVSALSLPSQTYVELQSNIQSPSSSSSIKAKNGGSGSVLTCHPSFPTITQTIQSTSTSFSNEIRQIRTTNSSGPSSSSASSLGNTATFGSTHNGNNQDIDPMSRNPSLRKEIWRFVNAAYLVWKVYIWDSRIVDSLMEKSGLRRLADRRGRIGRWARWCGMRGTEAGSHNMRGGHAVVAGGMRVNALDPNRERESVARELRRLVEGRSPIESRRLLEAARASATTGLKGATDEIEEDEEEDEDYRMQDEEEDSDALNSESSSGASDDDEDEDEEDIPIPGSIRARSITPAPLEELHDLLQDQQDMQPSEDEDDLTPVLLAHMQAGLRKRSSQQQAGQSVSTTSPLTRRRYNTLLQSAPSTTSVSYSSDNTLASVIASRRRLNAPQLSSNAISDRDQWDDSTFRNPSTCVICCTDSRTIVLWPCRCLALCDGCRGELASRSSGQGGSSLCPCCRSEVQGYSRLYQP